MKLHFISQCQTKFIPIMGKGTHFHILMLNTPIYLTYPIKFPYPYPKPYQNSTRGKVDKNKGCRFPP